MGPFELLKKIVEELERLKIPYIVTGVVAAIAYGEPRLTNDIDIVASIEERHIPDLLKAFPQDEFFVTEEMVRDAILHLGQFNIIHPESGIKVDVMLKQNTPFDNSRFNRIRRIYPSETYQANFASPEDVIIKKLEYYKEGGSEKYLRDITGILKISGDSLNFDYINEWSNRLSFTEIWEAVKKRLRISG